MNSSLLLSPFRWICFASAIWIFAFPALHCDAQSNEFWQAQNIYQIITDRFFDGDSGNNNAEGTYDPSGSGGTSVHGGDFKGIEKKLDYLKALGVTAIWISPVVLNANGEFHGYAGRDFYQVAPHWGGLTPLQQMIQAAHARGILVINDIVVNHGGDLTYSTDSGWSSFKTPPAGYNLRYRNTSKQFAAPFNTNAANLSLTNIFHNNGGIPDYNTAQHVELGELSGLDDFRTESPYVRSNMAEVYKYWVGTAGFDGFRIDTVKHVEAGFWQEWCPAIHSYAAGIGKSNFFMFGECFDGADAKCGSYTGTQAGGAYEMDSVVDYPLYFKINSVFGGAGGNTKQLEDRYNAIPVNYDPRAQMRLVTFLDNHDNARFLSPSIANNAADRLRVALVFLYTGRGIPCLYYGTEQGFNGTTDPNDREDMFDGQFEQGPSLGDNFNMTHSLFQWVARLNNFRRLYPALQIGSHVNKWNNPSGPGLFAYARRLGTQEVFVVFNTAASTQTLTNRSTIFAPSSHIVNLLDTNEVLTVTATPETPPISVPSMSAKIFVSQSDWRPLDPVVTTSYPAHDAANVPTYSPITLQFSKPMDTNSVQAAFRTTPVMTGSFTWSASRDIMTFTPGGAGLPALATVTVRVTNAVDAVSGNSLFAPYEMFFRTTNTTFQDLVPPTVAVTSPVDASSVTGLVTISGSASDNIGVQQVEVRLDSGAWQMATGTSNWNFSLNSSNFLNGSHTIAARAMDAAGNLTTNALAVRFVNVPGSYEQRLSGGNLGNVLNCDNSLWLRDQPYAFGGFGYSGGTTGYLANTITGICSFAQSLYQRERYSASSAGFMYQFDCPSGIYETTLLDAETYWSNPGQRVFNIFIQGRQVATNLDILAAAGGKNLPLTVVFTNAVTNSQLQVKFMPVTDNARVSGIQVRKVADVFSDTDGIPDWWRLAYFGHALGQAGDKSRASDDADGDGVSNLNEFFASTDPTDSTSVFRITKIAVSATDMQLSFSTAANRDYQLQCRDSLSAVASWANVGAPVPGTGDTVFVTDFGGATNTARYYRVQAR